MANFAQYKHDPKVKAVRVNGQITEVKQPKTNLILRWVTFFSGRNISQIVLIGWNFGKTQILQSKRDLLERVGSDSLLGQVE